MRKGDDKNLACETFDYELEMLLQKAETLIPEEILPDLPYMEAAPDTLTGIHLSMNYGV